MFSYKVKWWDDEGKISNDLGVVAGNSFAEASQRIEKYFGQDTLHTLEVIQLNDSNESLLSVNKVEHLADLFDPAKNMNL
jgi:hypothetical protein